MDRNIIVYALLRTSFVSQIRFRFAILIIYPLFF
jgi:hypothetical protein